MSPAVRDAQCTLQFNQSFQCLLTPDDCWKLCKTNNVCIFQFSSLANWVIGGDRRDETAEILWVECCGVFCMIFLRNKLNGMDESKHPWRTPTVVTKNPPNWHCWGSHSVLEWLESVLPVLKLLRTCHRPACQTLVKCLLEVYEVVEQVRLCQGLPGIHIVLN